MGDNVYLEKQDFCDKDLLAKKCFALCLQHHFLQEVYSQENSLQNRMLFAKILFQTRIPEQADSRKSQPFVTSSQCISTPCSQRQYEKYKENVTRFQMKLLEENFIFGRNSFCTRVFTMISARTFRNAFLKEINYSKNLLLKTVLILHSNTLQKVQK